MEPGAPLPGSGGDNGAAQTTHTNRAKARAKREQQQSSQTQTERRAQTQRTPPGNFWSSPKPVGLSQPNAQPAVPSNTSKAASASGYQQPRQPGAIPNLHANQAREVHAQVLQAAAQAARVQQSMQAQQVVQVQQAVQAQLRQTAILQSAALHAGLLQHALRDTNGRPTLPPHLSWPLPLGALPAVPLPESIPAPPPYAAGASKASASNAKKSASNGSGSQQGPPPAASDSDGGRDTGDTTQPIYVGVLRTYSPQNGYGFIRCPQLREGFDRDIYIHKAQLPDGASCGISLSFSLRFNKKGQPQAHEVDIVADVEAEGPVSRSTEMLLDFEFEAVNEEHVSSSSSSQCSRPVRICSWNILAAAYANCKVFPDVEPSVIAWPRRRPLIAAALERLNADVLCLQEVDRPFEELGLEQDYDYVRAQRPDMRADGCIIAWRKRDFNILHKEEISFDDYLPEVADESDVEATQRFRRGNCAVLARLQPIGERPFVVATAHLCWEAGCEDVRQLQAEVLLKKLEPHSTKLGHRAVLCGDLNAVPGCVSHGIITRSLPSVYSDLEAVGAVTNSNATATSAVIVSENGHQAGGNADASKAAGFAAMLDYICLDARSAVACSRLRLPGCDELRDNLGGSDGPLPTLLCKSWPSDHLPVAADVIFTMNWQ